MTRTRTLVTVLLVAPLLAGPALAADPADAVRTTSGLGGYRAAGQSAPLRILYDDPSIPIPRDPGAPLAEADEAYTSTGLSTGPQGRALASSLWPGPLVGDGAPTITAMTPTGAQEYPAKADARYPAGPTTADGVAPVGTVMHAVAKGLDVTATASSGDSPSPGSVLFDNVASTTTSTVDAHSVAMTRSLSVAQGLTLAAGVIEIKSVRTDLLTTSDGTKAVSSGGTAVNGLTVAGQGYTVDEKGAHPVAGGKPAPSLVPVPANPTSDPLKTLGIVIAPLEVEGSVDGSTATRSSSGLVISVDTVMLNAALNTLPYQDFIGGLPNDVQSRIYQLFAVTPKITYVIAAGESSTAANLPIRFAFPALPAAPAPPAPAAPAGPPASSGGNLSTAPLAPAVEPGLDTSLAGSALADPVVSGPVPAPVALRPAADQRLPGSGGVGVALFLLGLGVAALAGRGLQLLQAGALGGGGLLGRGCALGAPQDVPDLRTRPAGA